MVDVLPSPKSQIDDVVAGVEILVNVIESPVHTEVGVTEKLAVIF